MLISVIVPVFNAQATLEQCVRSVLSQGFADFELILVDDGSQDASGGLCDAFGREDACVSVLHQENGGLASARNAGIRQAKGEYLVHLDCDDYLADGGLAMVSEQVRRRPDADVLVWHISQLTGDVLEQESAPFPDTAEACLSGREAFRFLFGENHGSLWQTFRFVTRRSFVTGNGLFYRLGVLHEDIDFNPYVVLRAGKVHFCPAAYYVYRKSRDGSVTSRVSPARCRDILLIARRWFNDLRGADVDPADAEGFRATLSRVVWDYLPHIEQFPEEERRALYALLRENRAVLEKVREPRLSAWVKRALLAALGPERAARAFGRLRAARGRG